MMGTKRAKNFGGRPTTREREPGKLVNLSAAIPLSVKRAIEKAAADKGRSVSNEVALRLEATLTLDRMYARKAEITELLAENRAVLADMRAAQAEAAEAIAEMRALQKGGKK